MVNVTTTNVRPLVIEPLARNVRMIGYEDQTMVRPYWISLDRRRVRRADALAAATGGDYRHSDCHTAPIGYAVAHRHAHHYAHTHTNRAALVRHG